MIGGRIVGAVSFERLKQTFIRDLTELVNQPSRRVWVVVPTELLALDLSRAAADALGGVAGLEFLTLRDAARTLAATSLARQGLRPIPLGARELVLERAVADLPDDSCLAGLRGFSGCPGAIARAVKLLKNGLWSPEALRRAASRMTGGGTDAAERLSELAGIWGYLEQFKRDHRFFDDDDLLFEAAGTDGLPPPHVALIYGFYDLTPLQEMLVRKIVTRADRAAAYLLWSEDGDGPAPGFEYAVPAVSLFKELLDAPQVLCIEQDSGGTDLSQLLGGVFSDLPAHTAATGSPPERTFDGSVRILNCPGEMAEAEQVLREVVALLRARPEGVTVGVLMRTEQETASQLSETCERAGLAYYLHEGLPLADSVAGRILLSLLELAGGEAQRSAVVDFLSLADAGLPEDLTPTALDRLSRMAGIVKGWECWLDRLRSQADSLRQLAERAEHEAERDSLQNDATLCLAACEFLRESFQGIRALAAAQTWREAASKLSGLLCSYIPDEGACRQDVLELVRAIGHLDVTGLPTELGRVRRLLQHALRDSSRTVNRFQRASVTLASLMASRGAIYDVVVVPRLVEKGFPLQISADPLLSDRDRTVLNKLGPALGCGKLPLQSRRSEEERYLFRIALGSARHAVVLSYPRMEQDTGKARIPSRFIEQVCEALYRRAIDPRLINDGALGGLVTRVKLLPTVQPGSAIDLWEYDLAVNATAVKDDAVDYTSGLSRYFGRAVQMDRARWSQSDFGPYDGRIRDTHLLGRLGGEYASLTTPVSVSRLETYARCPFEYFLRYVLNVGELDKPAEEHEISPLEWGLLVHDFLSTVYRAKLRGRRLGELTDSALEEVMALASSQVNEAGGVHAAARPAAWLAAREQALDLLRMLLRFEREENADAAPDLLEFSFGFRRNGAEFRFEVDPTLAIALRGRIDRVDRLPGEGIQIIDYKTGKDRYSEDSFDGGRQLQLPLYLTAAARLLGASEGRARYLFTDHNGQKFKSEFTLKELQERSEDMRRIVRLIIEGISGGDFFLMPAEERQVGQHCDERCAFMSICGQARRKLSSIKRTSRDLSRLRELWAIR